MLCLKGINISSTFIDIQPLSRPGDIVTVSSQDYLEQILSGETSNAAVLSIVTIFLSLRELNSELRYLMLLQNRTT